MFGMHIATTEMRGDVMLTVLFGIAVALVMSEAGYSAMQCMYVSCTVTMLAGVYRVIAEVL